MSGETTVLCDAGPLITLGKLNRLDLLAELLGRVQIPRAVYDEAVTQGVALGMSDAFTIRLFCEAHNWPIVAAAAATLADYQPAVILGQGEIELLALAQTNPNMLVLLDDETARAEARRLKLRVRGTLGVLAQAYRSGILSLFQVQLLIQEIAARPDIWIGAKLCEQVLRALRER